MDEMIIDAMLGLMEEEQLAIPSPRRYSTLRVDPFQLTEKNFMKSFRLPKNLAVDLMNAVEPLVEKKHIDLQTKVLSTLNFLGTGSYQNSVGESKYMNISQPSVSRCIGEVVDALNHPSIFNRWVHFPSTLLQLNQIARQFYDKFGLPGVIGAIDCTHVAIVPPNENEFEERVYVNRKYFHSINTQLICDANLSILNVNALFPGSSHDQYIWNNSNVLPVLERLYNNGQKQYHLIGDSGYALRPWCLTPLPDPAEGTPEFRFNTAFKRARATIERCNGVLKGRFRCLLKDRVLHYAPPKASKIINACTVLHNMCIAHNIEPLDPEDDPNLLGINEVNDPLAENRPSFLNLGRIKRDRIVQSVFR